MKLETLFKAFIFKGLFALVKSLNPQKLTRLAPLLYQRARLLSFGLFLSHE